MTRIENFLLQNGGEPTREVLEDRGEEKSEEKRKLEPEMSGVHLDCEGSVGYEADFVDTTEDGEVELHLPLEVDMDPDRLCKDIQTNSGAVAPSTVDLGQEEQRCFEPRSG